MIATPLLNQIVPGLYRIQYRTPAGGVNAFVLDAADSLTLIDTGFVDDDKRLLNAVHAIDKLPEDIEHIVLTHCHVDHTGNVAALKEITEASVVMHPTDAEMLEQGAALREGTGAAPGVFNRIGFVLGTRRFPTTVPPASVDRTVTDGDTLPIAGGLRAIHVPGHSQGQLAFLWERHGGVLFAADAAVHVFGRLRHAPVVEDFQESKRSLTKLCQYDFEVACFGHGKPITEGAATRFRNKWRAAENRVGDRTRT